MHEGPTSFCVVPDPVSGSRLSSPIRGPGLVHLHHTSQTSRGSQPCSSAISVAELPITGLGGSGESRLTKLGLLSAICWGSFSVHNRVIYFVSELNSHRGLGLLYLHYYCPFDFLFHFPAPLP